MKHDETWWNYRPTNWQPPSFVAYCANNFYHQMEPAWQVQTCVNRCVWIQRGLVGLVELWTHSASAITREQHCGWSGRARRLNMKVNSGCMLLVHSCGSCAIVFSCEHSYILLDQTFTLIPLSAPMNKNRYPDVLGFNWDPLQSCIRVRFEHRLPGLQDVMNLQASLMFQRCNALHLQCNLCVQ